MKSIKIGEDIVTYHFKDETGQSTATTISPSDIECIKRNIERGDDGGRLVINQNVTLFWDIDFGA